jgi:hypothetical protein
MSRSRVAAQLAADRKRQISDKREAVARLEFHGVGLRQRRTARPGVGRNKFVRSWVPRLQIS